MSTEGRRLRNVRVEQSIRAFTRLGYEVVRVRGSHYILKHPERGALVLPFHRGTIKVGIIMDAIKKSGISVEQFLELL